MQLFYQPDIQTGALHLDAEESRHCIRVLRKSQGDIIHVIDGNGIWITAEITDANIKKCGFEIVEKKTFPRDNYYVHIAIAPTKNMDRLEWFVEKSVEIGIHEISFIICQNSERTSLNTERLEKKAISAMKQSLKPYLPRINQALTINEWFDENMADEKYIAHLGENASPLSKVAGSHKKYLILIGPEGDFTDQEIARAIEHQYREVSLGKSRLRTETAGIVACHIFNLANQ